MDEELVGLNPDAETGNVFRSTYWVSLRIFIEILLNLLSRFQPDDYKSWVGVRFDNATCVTLGEFLQLILQHSDLRSYVAERAAYFAEHPRVTCPTCQGSKKQPIEQYTRHEGVLVRLKSEPIAVCRTCNGQGEIDNTPDHRDRSISELQNLADFLVHCGGFVVVRRPSAWTA